MYPARLFSLFPPFPRTLEVFVIMSFDAAFTERWDRVIAPGIRRVEWGGTALEPVRADTRGVSDSILTDILTGISRARCVLADISTVGKLDGGPIRNGNVMYEVGLAHAVRQPEEVILFRSDDDRLLFDVTHTRVRRYCPDEHPAEAEEAVALAVFEALKEVDHVKNLAVQDAVSALDAWSVNAVAWYTGPIRPPVIKNMGQLMGSLPAQMALPRLLQLGIVETSYNQVTTDDLDRPDTNMTEFLEYRLTPFGRTVQTACWGRLGLVDLAQRLAGSAPPSPTMAPKADPPDPESPEPLLSAT